MSEDKKICPFISPVNFSDCDNMMKWDYVSCLEEKCMAWGIVRSYSTNVVHKKDVTEYNGASYIYGCKLIENPQ
jgi:hypothetical protein